MNGRREIKHLIGLPETLALRMRLRAALPSDEHAGPDGAYRVRSLYFDNYQDKALREKLDGIGDRDKFRLRYYDGETARIRLEKKSKRDGAGMKRMAWITREDCLDLLAGRTDWMEGHADPLVREFRIVLQNHLLRPRTIVDYRREAYVFSAGNVRVTLDSDIRTSVAVDGFLDPALPLFSADPRGISVLEVKFDGYLPDLVADLVQLGDRQATAVSKYAICRLRG